MFISFLYFAFFGISGLIMLYLARHYVFTIAVLRDSQKRKFGILRDPSYQPSVTVLIPAHNEQRVIGRILHRMTELTYPKEKIEIIVIDDASTDKTGKIADSYAKSFDNIRVIHRSRSQGGKGKPDALNHALNLSRNELIVCFDADYCPQRDIIENLIGPFSNPRNGVVQGRVTVMNEPHNIVTRLVALERIGGYRIDQQARQCLRLTPQFGGTVGAIRRSLLEKLGGWDESMLAEDTDLTFRCVLAGFKVDYVKEAESYEEAVEGWRDYWRQRHRWALGHMQCAFKHSLGVLVSKHLTLREKLDGLLLLGVYFMPVLVLLSGIVCGILFFMDPPELMVTVFWNFSCLAVYSCVGNFAPFFEVGVGAYLDGRTRAQRLIPLLMFTFLLNVLISTKAFFDLTVGSVLGRDFRHWVKTNHSGNGNSYISNQKKLPERCA